MNHIPDSNMSQIPELQSSPAIDPNASPAAAQESLVATVRVINKDDLYQKILSGESIEIINILDPDQYKLGLIKGFFALPLLWQSTLFSKKSKWMWTVAVPVLAILYFIFLFFYGRTLFELVGPLLHQKKI